MSSEFTQCTGQVTSYDTNLSTYGYILVTSINYVENSRCVVPKQLDVTSPNPCGAWFGTFLDSTEHALGHHEADHLGRFHRRGRPPMRVGVTLADDEAGGTVGIVAENEGAK